LIEHPSRTIQQRIRINVANARVKLSASKL
jgi:hypothetical protein